MTWDGFRAIVSTEGLLRVRSRRGWNITEHVGFFEDLPVQAILDGELVARDLDRRRDFPWSAGRCCTAAGRSRLRSPPSTTAWALWVAVWTHEREGVVAKRLHESHVLSERTWLEIKNRSY